MSANPLKYERERRKLTIDKLSELTGVSRIAIIRNEQGCYSTPSPTICDFLFSDEHPTDVLIHYKSFQRETRKSNYGKLNPIWLRNQVFTAESDFIPTLNPITQWRISSDLSKAKISTLFCLHPDVISRLELRPHLVPDKFPQQFMDALINAGYPAEELEALNHVYRRWRKHERSRKSG